MLPSFDDATASNISDLVPVLEVYSGTSETYVKEVQESMSRLDLVAGMLTDGRYLDGHCLTLSLRTDPVVYIKLPRFINVAEVRITSLYKEPCEYCLSQGNARSLTLRFD